MLQRDCRYRSQEKKAKEDDNSIRETGVAEISPFPKIPPLEALICGGSKQERLYHCDGITSDNTSIRPKLGKSIALSKKRKERIKRSIQ